MYDYTKWLSHLGHPRLLVVGDLKLDRYVRVDAEWVSPNPQGCCYGKILAVISDDSRQTTTKQRFVSRAAQRQPHQILRVDRETRGVISPEIEWRRIDGIFGPSFPLGDIVEQKGAFPMTATRLHRTPCWSTAI